MVVNPPSPQMLIDYAALSSKATMNISPPQQIGGVYTKGTAGGPVGGPPPGGAPPAGAPPAGASPTGSPPAAGAPQPSSAAMASANPVSAAAMADAVKKCPAVSLSLIQTSRDMHILTRITSFLHHQGLLQR
jgi:hypothetical protein